MSEQKTSFEKNKPNGNPFTSFAWFPPQVNFSTQGSKEKVVLLLRKHGITNLGWTLAAIFFSMVPFIFFFIRDFAFSNFSLNIFSITALLLSWYLLVLGFIFTQFLKWYFNVYIVTNRRVIDVDFKGFFYKNISEAELTRIQDVSHSSVGTFALIFNYGELKIQTAAEFSDIEFERVPNPSEVHKIIAELLDEVR